MGQSAVDRCEYESERLRVRPWHAGPAAGDRDLDTEVAVLLTVRTTVALPETWRGDFTVERARAWIAERDAESPTLLVTDVGTGRVVGLLILAGIPLDEASTEVRIGYVIAEDAWGRGYATELVRGLIEWARAQPSVHLLTGGVDVTNVASVRVLENTGFNLVGPAENIPVGLTEDGVATYQLDVSNEWDQYAQSWDDDPGARAYATAAFGSLVELARTSATTLDGAHVLDFGCGTGLLTEHLVAAGANIDAVDTSRAMLDTLDAKIDQHGWTTVRTATELPGESSRFDLVVCSSVCSFLDDYLATVETLVSRLNPGGLFVQWDWEQTDDDEHGLTRNRIRDALTDAGLADIDVRTAFTVEVGDQNMAPLVGHGRWPHREPEPR